MAEAGCRRRRSLGGVVGGAEGCGRNERRGARPKRAWPARWRGRGGGERAGGGEVDGVAARERMAPRRGEAGPARPEEEEQRAAGKRPVAGEGGRGTDGRGD